MNYVYVAGAGTDDAIDQAITGQTRFALYSLINGLKQKDFGLHTLEGVTCDIREFARRFVAPVGGKIFTDSGGYSFIKGDIPPSKLLMLIDCYTVYLESELEEFDYAFSLDIPFSLKYDEFNTTRNVLDANITCMAQTRDVLEKNISLQDKFYNVWHFKMQEQFSIWKHIYDKLEMGKFVRNHAVGGLVGLKNASKVSFTPFSGISFYILNKYLHGPFCGEKLKIHYLGVYGKSDRFHIALLENLFNKYLAGIATVQMSYDSINPIHTVRMNADVPLYSLNGQEFNIYPSLLDVPEEILKDIAADDAHAQLILSEMKRRRSGLLLKNSASFSPINVYSNLQLDKFFCMTIDQYGIVNEVCKATSPTNLNGRLSRIFKDIEKRYPTAFSPYMKKTITLTLERVWYWNNWFVGNRDEATLELYMAQEIQAIGFPGRLR